MGACFNALLKRFVDALQGRLGLAKAGDIGKSGDIAAAGHGVAADFYDGAVQHAFGLMPGAAAHMLKPALRSEERRVGKEGRSRGWPYHYKKKQQRRGEETRGGERREWQEV